MRGGSVLAQCSQSKEVRERRSGSVGKGVRSPLGLSASDVSVAGHSKC